MNMDIRNLIRSKGGTPIRKAGLLVARRWPWPVPVSLAGLSLYVDLRSAIGRALYIQGEFDPVIFNPFIDILKPGDCFLDIGSNVGYYTARALEAVGPGGVVHAFDIDNRPLRCLYRTKEKNDLANLFIHKCAVGDAEGMVGISKEEDSGHTHIGSDNTPSIPMKTLDGLDETFHFDHVKGIKIDVEGSELKVLHGATRLIHTHKPVIVCEMVDEHLQSQGASVEKVLTYFSSISYTCEWLENVFSPAVVAYPA